MVSVVITTYNSAAFIAETLRTVLAQTVHPAEIIIADGGSADDTLMIVKDFGVKIAPQRSRNIPNGRNIGILAATSEWVALLDHDDLWEPTKLEKQIEAIRRFPEARMVLTDYVAFDGQGITRESHLDGTDEYYLAVGRQDGGYFQKANFTDHEWMIPLTSSCLISKGTEWFDEDLQGTDDIEFFLRMMRYPFVVLGVPLVRWRNNPGSVSHRGLLMELDFVKTMNKIMEKPDAYVAGVQGCVVRIRRDRMRQTALNLLKRGKPLSALSMLVRSI